MNAKDTAGDTPLYSSVARGRVDVVKLLLAHTKIDLGIDDDKAQDASAQVEQLAEAAFTKPRRVRPNEIDTGLMWTEQSHDGRQASLKLLRAAIEERSQRKNRVLEWR